MPDQPISNDSTTLAPIAPGLDPQLVHAVASQHPDCQSLDSLGLSRLEQAEALGLVPLGLPLPRGRRDLVVDAVRQPVVIAEIRAAIARAERRDQLLAQARTALAGTGITPHPGPERDQARFVQTVELPWPGLRHPLLLGASLVLPAEALQGLSDAELRGRIQHDPALATGLESALARVSERLWDYQNQIGVADDSWTAEHLLQRLARAARSSKTHEADDLLRRFDKEFAGWTRDRSEARGRAYVDTHFDFARFENLFPLARGMQRKLVLILGPTNSGKTHAALQALGAAASGVYLAPLRLLALEVMERLNQEGVPTTLLTGEEEQRVPGARHLASTIEMLAPDDAIDVAVIDEVQMLADPDRGWAWTAALLGVPAKTVYLLGAPEARGLIERTAAHLGEELEIIELERKTPLRPLPNRLEWEDVQAGDALIAFSRSEVHRIREIVQQRGLTAAAIYGALAPEVRRREAGRFLSGQADVVVATDAIGMGLNLPVRRILFTALEKYDGTNVRPLSRTEIRQISGRAGRFGKFEIGEYGVVARGTPQLLLQLEQKPDHRLGPSLALQVRPTRAMVTRLADRMHTHTLSLVIDCFATAKTKDSPYRVADLASLRRLAVAMEERGLEFADMVDLLFIPADLERDNDAHVFAQIRRAVETAQPMTLGQVATSRIERLDDRSLEELSRACDLYFWASRKFPALFPDRELARTRRAAISDQLSEILASTARRRKPPPPKTGFRGAQRKRYGPRRK